MRRTKCWWWRDPRQGWKIHYSEWTSLGNSATISKRKLLGLRSLAHLCFKQVTHLDTRKCGHVDTKFVPFYGEFATFMTNCNSTSCSLFVGSLVAFLSSLLNFRYKNFQCEILLNLNFLNIHVISWGLFSTERK